MESSDDTVEVTLHLGAVPRAMLACYWRWQRDKCNRCQFWVGARRKCQWHRPPAARYMDRLLQVEEETLAGLLYGPQGGPAGARGGRPPKGARKITLPP